jgi:hypothetical protein
MLVRGVAKAQLHCSSTGIRGGHEWVTNPLLWVSATTFLSWAINNTTAKNMTLSWVISNIIAKNMTHFLLFERNLGWAVKLFVAEESVMTKVHQHSPVHQLAILSIGWAAAFFHLALEPCFNQHCSTINLFWLLTFDSFFDHFFFQP